MGCSIKKYIFLLIALLLLNPAFAEDDFSGYMDSMRVKIQKCWNPPECLERDGHAVVKFSITRQGDIYASEILESSGNILYDESAMEALRKASPFERFPASTGRGSLTIKYSFDTAVVNTGDMQQYLSNAEKFYNVNNYVALDYINKAINEVAGDYRGYFLYGKRSKIKQALGDAEGAASDLDEAKRLKEKYDRKRIMASKLYAEMEQTPYSYFSLAHSYELAGDYENAIQAIDKAIGLTNLNNQYKRYKVELEKNLNKI